jgi:hypothetical protein
LRYQRPFVMLTSLVLMLSATVTGTVAATPKSVGVQAVQKVQRLGTTRITSAAPKAGDPSGQVGEVRPDPELEAARDSQKVGSPSSDSRVPAAFVPRPAAQSVVDATTTAQFAGINHRDQRLAGTGIYANTQFSLEPPDQGLCVGGGYVVETVNTVVRVRNTTGGIVQASEALNQFFGLAPEINRTTGVYGDFSSDPKCYYDAPTGRWFLTLLQIDIVSASGAFGDHAKQLIAVSKSGDPTLDWWLFSVDTTNDGTNGTPSHPGCPCYGDQPLIGADANGFYVTTNEFPIHNAGFNGAMVYAFSKAGLEAGTLGTVSSIYEADLAEGQAYSLQPTTTPAGASSASGNNGTEHFLSALEFTGGLDNRIALWSLTNTASLSSTPNLGMSVSIIGSEVYGLPAVMAQKPGSIPLADLIRSKLAPSLLGVKSSPVPLAPINSNDDRMNQAVYLNGHVWGALNTRVKSSTGVIRVGIAWFDVNTTGPYMAAQGYIAVGFDNVVFPSVAANASGDVLVAFTLLGQDYYPSAAFEWLHHSTGTGSVRLVKIGSGPQDGFTGYIPEDPVDGGIARWGDYSAATADGSGNLWFATETINQTCSFSTFLSDTSCGGTRTILANWGTTIAKVTP